MIRTGWFWGKPVPIVAAAFIECKSALAAPRFGAVEGQRRGLRLGRDRIGGLVHHFAGGADQPFRFELGKRLAVLLPAPIDIAALVNSSRRSKKLVQALLEQRVFAAFLHR